MNILFSDRNKIKVSMNLGTGIFLLRKCRQALSLFLIRNNKVKVVMMLLLFFKGQFFYPQQKNEKAANTVNGEGKTYNKPLAFDSTKSFQEQYKQDNLYQFIGLQLFLPPIKDSMAGPVLFAKQKSKLLLEDSYFTITGILSKNKLEQLKRNKLKALLGLRYENLSSAAWKNLIVHAVFILKQSTKEGVLVNYPLYWLVSESKVAPYSFSGFNSFIALPYFIKQKELYQNQAVVLLKDKSRWICTSVKMAKVFNSSSLDSSFAVMCLLKNTEGKLLQIPLMQDKENRNLITEKEYDWLDHAGRNEKMELERKEQEKKEKHMTECVLKYGRIEGRLIAEEQIKVGMNKEMCEAAWGKPWNTLKQESKNSFKEIWMYNWNTTLYFKDGVLEKVEN